MTPLRVGFNAYLLVTPQLRGWTRYTVNLLAALPAHGVRPVLYSNAPIHPDHLARLPAGAFEVRLAPPMRYLLWENRWLPRQLRADSIDVFHCPMNYGMPWSTPCPRVLTLHDAIDEVYYARRAKWRERWRLSAIRTRLTHWVARHRADHIITDSEHSKGDIVNSLRVPARRVSVVYLAPDSHFCKPIGTEAVEAVREKYGLRRPYFLYLGGWEGRKNVPFLVRGFASAGLADVELVLAGGKSGQEAVLMALAAELKCADRLRLVGFVPDDKLPALYRGAMAFVYPSEYEGFGLQACEAMAVGCPVLVANATSLPEVAGDGGEAFSLNDPGELAGLLRRVASEDGFRSDLAVRAKERAANFSWDEAAAKTVAVYRQLLTRSQT